MRQEPNQNPGNTQNPRFQPEKQVNPQPQFPSTPNNPASAQQSYEPTFQLPPKRLRGRHWLWMISILIVLAACGTSTATTQQTITIPQKTSSPIQPTSSPTKLIRPTPSPTRQGTFPVCSAKTADMPCVQYASIQDAAEGESQPSSSVHSSISKGIVKIVDDITNVVPTATGPDTTLDAIQYQCFNIQQGLWYGLKSTINPDGSQTFRKSPFSEVDIAFIDHNKGNVPFASCRLTSAGVDKIDKAGMWDDGDYTGAWSLYDGTAFE